MAYKTLEGPEGLCPKCKREGLVDAGGTKNTEESIGYYVECPKKDGGCGWHGMEWYELKFDGYSEETEG